jgi:hypothetical protein
MKLLQELSVFDYSSDMVKESLEQNNGRLIVRGVIQRADTLNANGRVYPRHILEREIQNYQKLVHERRATGELDHADDPVVNLKNVSHVITKLWMEDNAVWAEVEVLDNLPMGKILFGLFERNIKVGISSRALGSVEHTHEGDLVQDDLHFICWDFVSEPSTPGAWMMKEGKEYGPEILNKIFSREDRIWRAANEMAMLHKKLKGGQ